MAQLAGFAAGKSHFHDKTLTKAIPNHRTEKVGSFSGQFSTGIGLLQTPPEIPSRDRAIRLPSLPNVLSYAFGGQFGQLIELADG